jgi:hypothetical protein
VCIKLPKAKDARSVSAAFSALLQATAACELDIEQAATLANVLDAHHRVIETEDLEARIAAIEERANDTAARNA